VNHLSLAASVAVVGFALAGQAQAADLYGSLGYASVQTQYDDFSFGTIQGRFGARFTPHLGVEGELAVGVSGDSNSVGDDVFRLSRKDKLNAQGAIYGIGYLPLSPQADLFARVGYGRTEIRRDFDYRGVFPGGDISIRDTEADNSWNFGVGAQYFFDEANGVRIDYTRHEFDDDQFKNNGDSDVWSLAYTRKF